MTSILTLAASGDASKVLQEMRVRALWSPYYLTKVVLGYKELVDHLHFADTELFIDRWLNGYRRQWIQWPRGFFKSTTFTIGTSIWIVCPPTEADAEYAINELNISEEEWFSRIALHNQDATQLFAFETDANAKKKVAEVRWHFEQNSLFRACFPEIAYQGSEEPWNNNTLKIRRVGFASRAEEGTFEAIGAGNALQSRHYDIVWEDDLVGKKAVESELEMEKTIRWHGLLNGAFVDAAKQVRFGVSNRWGYNDLNSHVMEKEAAEWIFHTRAAWEIGDEGKEIAIFPERYSIPALQEIRKSMSPYDFSCQYLNSPIAPGENEVDVSTLHYYTIEREGIIKCSCGALIHPASLLRSMHFDPYNAKKASSKSRPAVAIVGCSTDKHVILLDYYIERKTHEQTFQRLFELNDQWKPHLFTYEDVGNQNMTEAYIRKAQSAGDFSHRRFPRIEACKTGNRPKEIRIRDFLIPAFTRHKFAVRNTQLHFLQCAATFPHSVPDHDYDLWDALAQGAPRWRFPADEVQEAASKVEEEAYVAKLGQSYSYFNQVTR